MNEREYHDHHYETEAAGIIGSPLFAYVHDRAAQDFLRCTGAGQRHRVLSLGCGDGSIEMRLASHVGEIVGVELSPVAIEQARARAGTAGIGNITFHVSDVAALRAGDFGRFDYVAAFAFLHHLPDSGIRSVLRDARGALNPGGAFYSSDPSVRRLVGRFAGLVRKTYERFHSPDERELDPVKLCELASAAGFSRLEVDYVDFFLGPAAWLAPGCPPWLVRPLGALDSLMLAVPGVRRFGSSFRMLAHAA
jgi:SAM-dependent methyltransferase